MMNGLHKPSKGRVLVNGADTKTKTTAQVARFVGYVFQNPDDQIFNQDVITEIEYIAPYFKLPKRKSKSALTGRSR
jgi:energy-coupling factor transport system ATP-binding protein